MRKALAVAALLAITLAGCGWTQADFDSGHSRANAFESAITPSTVGSMQLHSLPLGAQQTLVAVVGNQMITQQAQDVVAYDTATCPRADNGACTPLWTRSGSTYRGGDGTHLVFTTSSAASTFEVTDAARRHLWDGVMPSATTPSESLGFTSITLAGDKLVAGVMGGSHGSYHEKVGVFPLAGCGSATCNASLLFDNGSDGHGNRWRASGNTLVLNQAPSQPAGLHVYDMTTGVQQWSASGQFELSAAQIRSTDLFVQNDVTPGIAVFDLTGHAGCGGSPVTCTPSRVLASSDALVPWDASAGDRATVVSGIKATANGLATHRLSFFTADGAGCATPCAPVATTAPVTTWSSQYALDPVTAGDVVLALWTPAGFSNLTYHVLAYDSRTTAGCSGSPKVCTPVADLEIPGQSDPYPGSIIVWAGRVYVRSGTTLYVFSLPGDVS
jgi:hypothetical protein